MQIPMRRRDHAHVHLPRRERPDALDLLMLQSAQQRAQILLGRHGWPGNVRELENVIGHAAMMVMGDTIDVRDLPEYLWESSEHAGAEAEPPAVTVDGGVARRSGAAIGCASAGNRRRQSIAGGAAAAHRTGCAAV